MDTLAASFRPHARLGAPAMAALATGQAGLALAAWAALSTSTSVLPGPGEVLTALGRLWREEGLGRALAASAATSAEAVALTALVSLTLGYLAVLPVMRPLVGLVSRGRFLGLMGLSFAFMLWVGGGHALKLAVMVFGMSVFATTSVASLVTEIPRERLDHARVLGLSPLRSFWEVVVRGTLDGALETLRQNAAVGWTLLTLVEGLVRSEGGIGALLLNQNKHFHLAEVFAIQGALLCVGLVQDGALVALRRALCPWTELRTGSETP